MLPSCRRWSSSEINLDILSSIPSITAYLDLLAMIDHESATQGQSSKSDSITAQRRAAKGLVPTLPGYMAQVVLRQMPRVKCGQAIAVASIASQLMSHHHAWHTSRSSCRSCYLACHPSSSLGPGAGPPPSAATRPIHLPRL